MSQQSGPLGAANSQLENLVRDRPLLAIESAMETFSGLSDDGSRSQRRRLFCEAVLRQVGYKDIVNPETEIFAKQHSDQVKEFAAVCLLRFMASAEAWCSDAPTFRAEAFRLFDAHLARPLYGQLKLDSKKQSFEKEEALRGYVLRTEQAVANTISVLEGIQAERWEAFGAAIHDLKKVVGKAKFLISHFVEAEMISGARIDEICGAVQEYFQTDERGALHSYEAAKSSLERFLLRAEAYGTRYSRELLGGLALKLLRLCIARFEKSEVSAPASISLRPPEKRYPLHSVGATLNLAFVFVNGGPGYAFDLCCKVTHIADCAEVLKPEVFLGEVAPRPIVVEFPIRLKRSTQTLIVELQWEWTNFDRTSESASDIVELVGQPSGVDWDKLALEDPYRLEPVANDQDLVGRTEQLSRLVAHASGGTVGSSCIYGQKRVGKTSIGNALRSKLQGDDTKHFLVIYAEAGSYVHPDPDKTIEQLGTRLCKLLRSSDKRFSNIPMPMFQSALTPLVEFLDDATSIASNARIIFMLDEFDKVPVQIFKRGLVGDAFFATIRSISHMPMIGFVLIGGERMQFVFDCQGEALNKFETIRVDYFDKERHWNDFQDLVRRPVKSWLMFSDEALVKLHGEAAGNPFFTVLVCRSLFKIMVSRRDCHVTCDEVEEAIEVALENCSPASFAHFWEDAILEPGDRQEEVSMRRRHVLIAMAEVLKKTGSVSKEQIIGEAGRFGMDGFAVERELQEFVHRQVLVEKEGFYYCKVPFLARWLKEVGFLEISTTLTDAAAIEARRREEEKARVTAEEVTRLCSAWPFYKGRHIGGEQVRAWLEQFGGNADQRLVFKILQNVKIYSEDELRAKMQEVHGIVSRGLVERRAHRQVKRSDILVSYLDGPGKSGAHIARLYCDENNIYKDNLVEHGRLSQALDREGIQALVFVDDFLGTGDSVSGYLSTLPNDIGNKLVSLNLRAFFVAVAGFAAAKQKISQVVDQLGLSIKIHVCDSLEERHHCFSEHSSVFASEAERTNAMDLAYRKGVMLCKQAPLGYGGCQAMVVFSHNCPNNTLPILWDQTSHWHPLFRRD